MSSRPGAADTAFWGDADDGDDDADVDVALARYRTLLDTIDEGVYQLDDGGRFVAVDDAVIETTGYSRETLLGEHVSVVLHDDDVERIQRAIATRLAADTRDVASFEVTARTADGGTVPLELRISLVVEDGEFQGTIGVARDVSEGERGVEAEPAESDRPFSGPMADVLDEANIGVFVLDESYRVAWADETVATYFGLDRDDLVGRDKRTVVTEQAADRVEDSEQFAGRVLATYDGTSGVEQFGCHITAGDDREERWLEHYSRPIDSGQYAGGRIELYYDVTERTRSADELLETEARFHSLVDAVEEYALFRMDPDGHVVSWNEGAKAIKGYEPDEILGEHFSTFYTEADREAGVPERNLRQATESGSVEDEGWRVRKDGSEFWANVTITAVYDDDGTHRGFVKVTRDMTDRRRRERELESELQQVLGRISDAFYAVDDDLRFTHVNEQAEALLQQSEDELLGTHLWDVFPSAADTDAVRDAFRTAMESQAATSYETYVEAFDFWVEANLYPSETGISVYFRDVTERKERERELERRARQQHVVADLGQFALETDDLDELMEEAARQVASVLDNEYTKVLDLDDDRRELLVRQGVGWDEGIVGEATVAADDDSQAGYTLLSEGPVVVEDLPAETRFSGPDLLTDHGVRSGISTIIGSVDDPWGIFGTHDTGPQQFSREDVKFVQSVANVIAEAIERDRYQGELEDLVADLQASNERLEQFAYAASHDLQEPLRMVSSYLQLIETRYGDELDADGEEFLEYAVDGADRMRDMIDGLLQYSRVETQGDPFEPVDLDDVLDVVVDDLQVRIDESDAVVETTSLPRVMGDPSQLRQVFQNLLSNAIEYSGDEPPRIDVSAERDGSDWIVSVRDQGVGIDPDDADRIFEVFQRLHTHEEHTGTGIGLALCQRIVERHGGEIWVDAAPGDGATFSFTLPAMDG
ncbi:PAS domain S-box-containing protein [Halomicrobium zhouii]|uniref:histidine kinase n=1 Tax=Halomicrobium zhouii TaxID=767519 RepID=A0A1I6LXJ7_9EURY|nr:PAS domain S-box protein [Halomicrobium zhouii]SFS08104.1 PAS domain S-box-containing protein [Halomicrobium zhouii]